MSFGDPTTPGPLQVPPAARDRAEHYADQARTAGAAADRQAAAHIAQAYATMALVDMLEDLVMAIRASSAGPAAKMAPGSVTAPRLPGDIGMPGAPIAEASQAAIAMAQQLASGGPRL